VDTPAQRADRVAPGHPWSAALVEQLSFYGFRPHILGWDDEAALDERRWPSCWSRPRGQHLPPQALAALQRLKARYVASYVYCLSVPSSLEAIVGLQRAGANVCIPAEIKLSDILSRILDLVESREQETHRVLIVEDSRPPSPTSSAPSTCTASTAAPSTRRWRCSRSAPNTGRTPS
jgi:hypothetical protein